VAGGYPGDVAAPWTIARVLEWTRQDFAVRGFSSPRLDAELLIAHALKLKRVDLYVRYDQPLNSEELAVVRALVERRRRNEPVAYILGEREFYGRRFAVDPRVLVPRPETEGVVEAALGLLPPPAEGIELRVLDVGTGSGAIAVTLAAERPDLRVTAVDVSPAAAEVARGNAQRLGVGERVQVVEGALYQPVGDARFHVIVSNPPYIRSAEVDTLMPDVRQFEPRLAIDGGPTGEAVLAPLVRGARAHLEPGGALVVELSYDQADRARELAREAGFADVEARRDLAGIERVLVARR
jgi:release factor glutamine methyltransferase